MVVERWFFTTLRYQVLLFTNPQIQNLFPPPRTHASQKLEITLRDILRNQFAQLSNKDWEQNHSISLPFDPLRDLINMATRRHLFQEGVLEDDDDFT